MLAVRREQTESVRCGTDSRFGLGDARHPAAPVGTLCLTRMTFEKNATERRNNTEFSTSPQVAVLDAVKAG